MRRLYGFGNPATTFVADTPGGAFRCDYENRQGYRACPIPYADRVTFFWKQVNFNVF